MWINPGFNIGYYSMSNFFYFTPVIYYRVEEAKMLEVKGEHLEEKWYSHRYGISIFNYSVYVEKIKKGNEKK